MVIRLSVSFPSAAPAAAHPPVSYACAASCLMCRPADASRRRAKASSPVASSVVARLCDPLCRTPDTSAQRACRRKIQCLACTHRTTGGAAGFARSPQPAIGQVALCERDDGIIRLPRHRQIGERPVKDLFGDRSAFLRISTAHPVTIGTSSMIDDGAAFGMTRICTSVAPPSRR